MNKKIIYFFCLSFNSVALCLFQYKCIFRLVLRPMLGLIIIMWSANEECGTNTNFESCVFSFSMLDFGPCVQCAMYKGKC